MRRHEVPRHANIRVEVPTNPKWADLNTAQQRTHIHNQIKSLGTLSKQPKIECLCGKIVPYMYAYRCYACGAFWCPKCAGKHFS